MKGTFIINEAQISQEQVTWRAKILKSLIYFIISIFYYIDYGDGVKIKYLAVFAEPHTRLSRQSRFAGSRHPTDAHTMYVIEIILQNTYYCVHNICVAKERTWCWWGKKGEKERISFITAAD